MTSEHSDQNEKLSRQEYNRQYYQRNKHLWSKKEKSSPPSRIVKLVPQIQKTKSRPNSAASLHSRVLGSLEAASFLLLSLALSVYLVSESSQFYLASGDTRALSIFKAVAIESLGILFFISTSSSRLINFLQKGVAVLLWGFTLCLICGQTMSTASTQLSKVKELQAREQLLSRDLQEKGALRASMMNRRWIRAVRGLDQALTLARERLMGVRFELARLPSESLIRSCLALQVILRLLALAANLICVHRFAEGLESRFR